MNIFIEHPKEVNMTYFQHLKYALNLSILFIRLSFVSFVHAFFPFLFTKTASTLIKELYMEFSNRKEELKCCCKSDKCNCKKCNCKCKKCKCCNEKKDAN